MWLGFQSKEKYTEAEKLLRRANPDPGRLWALDNHTKDVTLPEEKTKPRRVWEVYSVMGVSIES